MTKVHGKRYAYKFDFHALMQACQTQGHEHHHAHAAAAAADVQVNGAEGRAKGYTQKCCNYSAMGKGTYGYDCLSIPNAEKATAGMKMNNRVCGSNVGLPLADNEALTADGKQTICSKSTILSCPKCTSY